MGNALADQQRGGERATVLSNGPIPEIKLGPVAAPNPRGVEPTEDFPGVDRDLLDPAKVAPVVADARLRPPARHPGPAQARRGDEPVDEAPKKRRHFVVLEAKQILDKTSGARTRLPAGKPIHDGHYDIAHLLRQGVRLKETDAPGTTAGDEALIDAMTR
jgi:hypothetical protein